MKPNQNMRTHSHLHYFIFLILMTMSTGCYSVVIASKHAIPEPDELNNEEGYYKNKQINTVKESLKLSVVHNHVIKLEDIGSRGFHSVEYRVTLGDVLLSGLTFGKIRKMRVIYVAEKEQN